MEINFSGNLQKATMLTWSSKNESIAVGFLGGKLRIMSPILIKIKDSQLTFLDKSNNHFQSNLSSSPPSQQKVTWIEQYIEMNTSI